MYRWDIKPHKLTPEMNYTYRMRGGFAALTASVLSLLVLSANAIEKDKGTAVLLTVTQKTHDRVLYYLYNTPVMQEEPYVEISLKLSNRIIVGEYIPSYSGEPTPHNWKSGESLEVRLDKHYVYLPRLNGTEVKFRITDRYTPKESASNHR
jgi:hypothetical protein